MVILIKSWKNVLLWPILFLDNWYNPDESGNFYFSIYSCQKLGKDVQGIHLYKLVKYLASEVIRKISEWCAKKIPSLKERNTYTSCGWNKYTDINVTVADLLKGWNRSYYYYYIINGNQKGVKLKQCKTKTSEIFKSPFYYLDV